MLFTPDKSFFESVLEYAKKDLGINYATTKNKATLVKVITSPNKYMAGVVFDKKVLHSRYYTELEMTLRFPPELRRDSGYSWETKHLLPKGSDILGPRNEKDTDGGVPVGYLSEGFLQLQNSIAMGFLQYASGYEDLPTIQIRRFPYASYMDEPMCQSFSSKIMPSMIFLSFLYPVIYITYVSIKIWIYSLLIEVVGYSFNRW